MIDRLIDLGYVQQTLAELVSIPSVNPPGPRRRGGWHLALRMEELGARRFWIKSRRAGLTPWAFWGVRDPPWSERPSRRCSADEGLWDAPLSPGDQRRTHVRPGTSDMRLHRRYVRGYEASKGHGHFPSRQGGGLFRLR